MQKKITTTAALAMSAEQFVKKLKTYTSPVELKKYQRYFKFSPPEADQPLKGDEFIGVRMGQVFALAKEFIDMPPEEIEKLLENPIHEVRAGALSIMGKQASSKKISEGRLKELYDLYIRRHDRINNWDLVDLAAYYVVGRYLADKPRNILYKLARSKNTWERRTAIVSTAHFIRQGDVADTFKIAGMLVNDVQDLIHKATGWMLRYAGDKDRERLLSFLDEHAATMSRVALRNAIEHFDKKQRDHYLSMKY
ncbi:MAG TPA: DNA alkylation repair protein [Bacteroidota bacterium]